MLFTGCEVRMRKNCARLRGLENGLSPNGEGLFKTDGTVFFIRTEAVKIKFIKIPVLFNCEII
jgi:hypothetical protein